MCVEYGRKKETSVYCRWCNIMSHRETYRQPSCHAYCMGDKYQYFQRHVANWFVNQIKNDNNITQRIIKNNPVLTIVAGPQKKSFRKIKHKRRSKTAAQTQIQRLSLPVSEVVIENGKSKNTAKRSLKKLIQKAKTGKKTQKLT